MSLRDRLDDLITEAQELQPKIETMQHRYLELHVEILETEQQLREGLLGAGSGYLTDEV